jgi:hypothetical protein
MTNEKLVKLELCPERDDYEFYQHPEKEYSTKGDLYSLGCIIYQLV